MNTTYAERQLKVAKAAEDQEAAELTLFMQTKLSNERRERIVTTISQLLRLYAIVMCSCLVVFTPQKCLTASQGITCSTAQNASWADVDRRTVLAVNFITCGCLVLGELLYYNREIWMIRCGGTACAISPCAAACISVRVFVAPSVGGLSD